MKLKLSEPGYVVSGGIHLLALLLLLLTLSSRPETFDPMQETVPIETVTDSEFNKVMQGDKSAKEVVKDATAKVDKVDPNPDPTPKPVTTPADKTVPTPPPPPVEQPPAPTPPTPPAPPPPQAAAQPTPPTPPAPPPPVPTPPTPPERPQPAPSPSVPTPPERVDTDAEPIAPKPVPTPPRPPEKVAEAPKPTPPVKPHPVLKPPKAVPKPDQLAKLLDQEPDDQPAAKPTPKATKAARHEAQQPPSAPQETDVQSHNFDLTDISRLLSHDAPSQKAATGREPSRVASLGSATAHADTMAPSLWGQLDGLMEEQYRQCWSYLGLNPGQKYVPQIRVTYDENGGLSSDPVLVNPPSDPNLRNLAESALRAVRRCNPLRIPAQYAPYYDEWKGRVLRFDPQEMAG